MSGPTKDEDPTVAAVGLQGLAHQVSFKFNASNPQDKLFSTLRARLAIACFRLSRADTTDGERIYFVSRWNMLRELHNLNAVAAFAKQVGGADHE
jgi:hypothetical protein